MHGYFLSALTGWPASIISTQVISGHASAPDLTDIDCGKGDSSILHQLTFILPANLHVYYGWLLLLQAYCFCAMLFSITDQTHLYSYTNDNVLALIYILLFHTFEESFSSIDFRATFCCLVL